MSNTLSTVAPPADGLLTIRSHRAGRCGDVLVVVVSGEIDLSTLPHLDLALTCLRRECPRAVVVALDELRFCSASGMARIAEADRDLQRDGTGVAVAALPPGLHRLAALVWPHGERSPHRTVADAVHSLDPSDVVTC